MDKRTAARVLRGNSWFAGLARDLADMIVAVGRIRPAKNTLLFAAGDEPNGLFAVLSGDVHISQTSAQGGHGLSIVNTSTWTIVMQAGTFAGYLSFGTLAEKFGPKRTYIAYLLIAAAAVPIFASVASPWLLLLIGPIVGFFGTGYFSGFAVITADLFPTPIRATAMGFVYNIGRIASAAAPYLIGLISEHHGLPAALLITSAAFLLAALIATNLSATPHLSQ